MRKLNWYIITGIALIAVSAASYAVQVEIFHRPTETFFYLLQDLAFLPVQVLLVSFVVNRWFQIRERRELLQKLNMVVGIFFMEMGSTLLRYFSEFDEDLDEMRRIADVKPDWTNRDFAVMQKRLDAHKYDIDCRCANMNDLKRLLASKREFLLGLLANPSLLENTSFTELLWAISHLTEELELRIDLDNLPDADYQHLAGDMRRAYVQMVHEWISYVLRLKGEHPYMYSLIARTDPFDPHPSAVVGGDNNMSN